MIELPSQIFNYAPFDCRLRMMIVSIVSIARTANPSRSDQSCNMPLRRERKARKIEKVLQDPHRRQILRVVVCE